MNPCASRRPCFGARRHAKGPRALLAEIPRHLRRGSGGVRQSHSISSKFNRAYDIIKKPILCRQSAVGGPSETHAYQQQWRTHRRQEAMVWEDLVSVVRLEVTDAGSYEPSLTEKIDIDSSLSSIDNQLTNTSTEVSTLQLDSDGVPCKSPPRVKRMSFCFDANGSRSERLGIVGSTIARMVRRLSPQPVLGRVARRMSPPVMKRMSFSFGRGGSNPSDSVSHTISRSDTYISDSESDTSSLDYSDDEEVERAILASAAVFSQSVKIEDESSTIHDCQECAICLECTDTSNLATVDGCGHSFCFGCIDRWATKKNDCPLCKEKFHLVTSSRRVRWY